MATHLGLPVTRLRPTVDTRPEVRLHPIPLEDGPRWQRPAGLLSFDEHDGKPNVRSIVRASTDRLGMMVRAHESRGVRKARGAFFTPPAIADFLADWAVREKADAKVLDPTCGEAVFLLAVARKLRANGCPPERLRDCIYGVDLHRESLSKAQALLSAEGLDARLLPPSDFFDIPAPDQLACPLPLMDAVVGNPPFVRYQGHTGVERKKSLAAALRQGVRLNGLASSWAATLVHACSFLKDDGRLAMVMPAELLTVQYAEPIRRWLRTRFERVTLVMFEQLQFEDALEKVVLVVGQGTGGCDSFNLHYVHDASDLATLHPLDTSGFVPNHEGKWSDLLLSTRQRQLFKRIDGKYFTPLNNYGAPELGTVTGANDFFVMTEARRAEFRLEPERHVLRTSPPGSKHLSGLTFTMKDWEALSAAGESVWMLRPADPKDDHDGLMAYVKEGESLRVQDAYKCSIRDPWYRPPAVTPPDLFFTYMSHRYPRLVTNTAGVTFVNSMHGIRLLAGAPKIAKAALPVLCLNSVTMLGAELHGRSYGGGILKMEPREAGRLPVPTPDALARAWSILGKDKTSLGRQLQKGLWVEVSKRVDDVLLSQVMGVSDDDVTMLHEAARALRSHRLGASTHN